MALRRRGPRHGHDLFPGFTDVYEIGVGSLAVVFRAREIGTNRNVALKLLNVRDASPRSIESFERESIALGALSSHPNIVTLYRTFRTPDGRPVLVLELCSGAVADRLRNGAGLPVPEVVSIGVKVAGALETAHRGGILHRDVKPQNILVTEFGEPALADFGVAMLQSSTQTTAGLFDFTTLHAAPELLEGTGTSAATDVYELASSLYQLIAGQSAFRAYDGESPASVILRILRDPVRPLLGTGVPMALSDLLIRAMSKEKDERPPTAAEFAAELAEVEIAQGWNRTQFLIRDPGPLGTGVAPAITRMPDAVPRGIPSTLVSHAPTPLTPVGPAAHTAPPMHAQPVHPSPVHPSPVHPAPVHPAPVHPSPVQPRPVQPPAVPTPAARPAATQPAAAQRPPVPAPQAAAATAPAVQAPMPPPPGRAAEAADWSAPTLVTSGGWSAPPAEAPATAPPVVVPTSAEADTWWSPPPTGPSTGSLRALPAEQPSPVVERPTPGASESSWAPTEEPQPAPLSRPAVQLPPSDWAGFAPPPAPPTLPPPPVPPASPAPSEPGAAQPPEQPTPEQPTPEQPTPEQPTPEQPAPPRRDRIPVQIDDEFLPAGFYAPRHIPDEPPAAPQPPAQPPAHEPAPGPQAAPAAAPAGEAAVPVWAVRAPVVAGASPDEGPQFISDLSMDPLSLRPRTTVRAGASAVTIDEHRLRLRTWFTRSSVPWPDIHGFEPQLEGDQSPAVGGMLVALTSGGPVELPGTRRPLAELRYLHALLDAYRIRAQHLANR